MRLSLCNCLLATLLGCRALAEPAVQPTPRPGANEPQVSRDLAYVPHGHARQKLDLYLPKDGANLPLIINIHGDRDPLVPHHQSELLEAALKQAGVPVTFYTVQGAGHGRFNDPKVPELTRQFLSQHLQPARP